MQAPASRGRPGNEGGPATGRFFLAGFFFGLYDVLRAWLSSGRAADTLAHHQARLFAPQ